MQLLKKRTQAVLFIFLGFVWFAHGFAYYGIGHFWVSGDSPKEQMEWLNLTFANFSEILTKIIVPLICIRTRRTVTPFSALLCFVGITFILKPIIVLPQSFGSISLLYQLSSVLLSASWNLLWFITPLAFPGSVR